MEKNFIRKLKNINNTDYIINSLIKKSDDQKGGGQVTVKLNKTQEQLLKTLKNLNLLKIKPSILNSSFDELESTIKNLKDRLTIIQHTPYLTKVKPFTQDLTPFDKFLNDIGDEQLNISYSNNYSVIAPLKLNMKPIENLSKLLLEISKSLDFKERTEKINIDKIRQISVELQKIDFNERTEKIDIEKIRKLKTELDQIMFNERTEKVNVDKIKQLKLDMDELLFKERQEKVNVEKIKKLKLDMDELLFKERQEKISIEKIKQLKGEYDDLLFNPRNDKVNIGKISQIDTKMDPITYNERTKRVDIGKIKDIKSNMEEIKDKPIEQFEVNLDKIKRLDTSIFLKEIDLDKDRFQKEISIPKKFIDDNYEIIKLRMESVNQELVQIQKIVDLLEDRIEYYEVEMNLKKISENAQNHVSIEELNVPEIEDVDGFNKKIPIVKTDLSNKEIKMDKFNILQEDLEEYYNEAFIDKIRIQQTGGTVSKYVEISIEYAKLLRRRNLLFKFRETIDKYNVLYIQTYYYQLFVLKNINKFAEKSKQPIYQIINKPTFLNFLTILNQLNTVINNPKEIFNDINSRRGTIHSIFYFRYFIVIKKLTLFFTGIKNLWDEKQYPDTFSINVFSNEIKPDSSQEIKDVAINFLLFNLIYPVLLKYQVFINK